MDGKKLKELRIKSGLSQRELHEETNIPLGTIGRIEASNEEIKKASTNRVFEEFFKNKEINSPNGETNAHNAYKPSSENIEDSEVNSKKSNYYISKEGDPYYENISASAGLQYLMDNGDHRATSFIKVPGIKVDGYINVFGDSMYPKYCSGEVIGVRLIDKDLVFFGHAYVLLMSDGEAYIKYIRRGRDNNHWSLESENEKYQPKEFHLSKIHKIFKIKAIVSRVSL